MRKDRNLTKFLNDWAENPVVQKRVQAAFDKDLQKALKTWESSGNFKVNKTLFKTISKTKFKKALSALKSRYAAPYAKHTRYDL